MPSDNHRVSRLIRMASEIQTSPQQDPPALIKALGISKPQFYKDKRALEKLGFSFRYDRAQKRFIIDRDPYIPIYDLTLTETFALVMAVRQLSATGDFILTYDALNAIRKIASNSPQDQREFLRSGLDDVVLKEGLGCDSKVLADLQKAVKEGRRISIVYDLYSEGGILFEVEVSEPKEVGWWVLQWGAEAEVLEPKSLRHELEETAERLLRFYGRMKFEGDKTQG